MLKSSLLALTLAISAASHAGLASGDMAFTTFNADEDGWAMATFVDIAANTKIYFTDNEWNGAGFNKGESFHQWLSGSASIAAGTVIRFSATDDARKLSSSLGLFSRSNVSGSNNFGLSQSAETVYAYLGTSATAPTTFLAAISTGAFSSAEGGLTNTGLSIGNGAIRLKNGSDFAEYTGLRTGQAQMSDYKTLVNNTGNWSDLGNGNFANLAANTSSFGKTITPVPEPETYALMGLGMIALLTRRRKLRV
ncbi:PEP-CTERM sorting domain-containing protein [Iodobacter arcticus]|uniref:PEP-CTERM sorting domain-containing protein n=1 Tax=Iodobacter arcticus TaxID=590593 RepID=A0ABW2R248_9NEIS